MSLSGLTTPTIWSGTGNVPPHTQAAPYPLPAPADAFLRLAGRRGVAWLDSSLPRHTDGRYSILACEPRWIFTARDDAWSLAYADGRQEQGATRALDRFDALLVARRAKPPDTASHLPFCGGVIGWCAYDLGRQFETLGGTAQDDLQLPDMHFAWHDVAAVWDHTTGETWLVAADGEGRTADEAISEFSEWLRHPVNDAPQAGAAPAVAAVSNLSRPDYMSRVEQIRQGIARGEYYQLNLVQRFATRHTEPAETTYLRLRALNPAPFAAFIASDDCTVLSSSPERFLEVAPSGRIRTCPIKGTRPRGRTEADDAAQQAELLSSPKERAELLMIVDLLRNDLGRVCVPGTVSVERLYALESFATVHHLVGEVQGDLRRDVTRCDLLRATFPGGSITGAPKVSAMCAIDTLEPHRRGIAMGSIGYISAHGRMDLNIAIRTLVIRRGTAYASVGAGIVWDSDPAAEYDETLAKAAALFSALGVQEVRE